MDEYEYEYILNQRNLCRSAFEKLLEAVNNYRRAHSIVESGTASAEQRGEMANLYVTMLVVADDMEKVVSPTIELKLPV